MPSKMVNLKETKAEAKRNMPQAVGQGSRPDYPWGTRISFDSKRLIDELGLDELEAGDFVTIRAKAKVVSISTNSDDKGDDTMRLEMQITDMVLLDTNDHKAGFEEA